MADYISRETALELIDNAPIIAGNENETLISAPKLSDEVYCIPAADVVARDCYDRILAENDTMREMLARIGKKCGDSMDDVRQVVHGEWWPAKDGYYGHVMCSACHKIESHETGFCPNCGAEMEK